MKRLNAYRKKHFGFINNEAVDGDNYFKDEWRFKKKIPFIKKMLVAYMLIGDYWIEKDFLTEKDLKKI